MNRHERRAAARLGRGTFAAASPVAGDPFALAVQFHQAGRLAEAEQACAQVLRVNTRHPGALHLLGVICLQTHVPQRALDLITQAIAIDPRPHTFHNNQGSALRALGRHAEAEVCFRRALSIKPDYVRALVNLGCVLSDIGKLDDAIAPLRRALSLAPNDIDGCVNLALLLHKQGVLEEAAAYYEQAARVVAQPVEILQNLAGVRLAQGRTADAIAVFRRVVQLKPDDADTWLALAAALEAEIRYTEAVGAYREAIRCEPARSQSHNALGNVLAALGQLDESVVAYREAIRVAPDNLSARSNLIMTLHAVASVSATDILAEARAFDAQARQGAHASPQITVSNASTADRPLRVGYVSADFRVHPVGFFMERVLPAHDASAFETVLYSDVNFPDEQTDRLRAAVKMYRSIVDQSDAAVAAMIATDGIDILVDLAGHTGSNRLGMFARRAAPLQVSWLGYFGTTGLAEMDFVVADNIVMPEGDEDTFTETPLRIDSPYLCWSPPGAHIPVGPFPVLERGYVTFGSFNNRTKLNSETLAAWVRILQRVRDSRLLCKSLAFADEGCRKALTAVFAEQGVEPERLLFEGLSPREEGLLAYNKIDIALDPFPFGGCTTTADTLWMGVPLVTQAGARWSGRMSQTILNSVGLQDWVVCDAETYVDLAVRMASNLADLVPLRVTLRQRLEGSAFCDGTSFTRRLEAAYRAMWRSRQR